MPVWRALLAIVLITVAMSAGAATPEAQDGPRLEVDLGVGGFTPVDRPSEVRADIASPVLVAGRLRARGGGVSVSRTVEVPAGGEQAYRLTVPPLGDGTRLTVELLDGDGESLVSETVNIRTPSSEELAVGVMGSDELVDRLGRIRGVVTDRPVAAFAVSMDASPVNLDVLDYLVVPRAEGVEAALRWARTGGRVALESSLAGGEVVDAVPTGVEGVTRAGLGAGTVLVVEGMERRAEEDWSAILRPAPLDLSHTEEGRRMMGNGDPLLQAASEAGTRQVPSLPWLLFAIVGFAVVVGPVNFLVLSRLGKRDWAWVTIPSLALVAVAGFWLAGRQRIGGTNLTHASVITAAGAVEARSTLLVAAGVAGERLIEFDPGTDVYPQRPLAGNSGPELRMVDDDTASVELDQLGFTGIGLYQPDPSVELPRVNVEEDSLVVENPGNLRFWGWGATAGGGSTVADGELGPGEEGAVAIPRGAGGGFGAGFVDDLINRHELWEDPARNNSLWPLSQVLFSEADTERVYFVGLTDGFRPQVSADGSSGAMAGPTLVLVAAEGAAATGAEAGAVVVDTGFVNWVDWGRQQVISTDEMTVRFRLPDPSLSPRLVDARRFGGAPSEYQAWDWEAGDFVPIQPAEPLGDAFVAPDGEVYVRLVGANEFGDNPMSPRDLSLEWDT